MASELGYYDRVYQPLTAVRLLRLRRRYENTTFIEGELRSFLLDSPDCPPFTTISYTWGEPRYTRAIVINGHEFPVLDSVYTILEAMILENNRMRKADSSWVWIDSICINQADEDEKASQVALMGRIFKMSAKTSIWLGSTDGESDTQIGKAFEFLRTLSARRGWLAHNFHVARNPRKVPSDLEDPVQWGCLQVLLEHPWWTRAWTLQECVIQDNLEFLCQGDSISGPLLDSAIYALWLCKPPGSLISESSWSAAWNRRRLRQWWDNPRNKNAEDGLGLVALLAYTGNCQFTDPRDRIYSLLGLARPADRWMVGRPAYRAGDGVANLYVRLVRQFLEEYQSLDIICFAQLFNGWKHGPDAALSWPSWVPDWRVHQGEPFVTPLMVSQSGSRLIGNFRPAWHQVPVSGLKGLYCASGETRPCGQIFEDGRLSVEGILIDVVGQHEQKQEHLSQGNRSNTDEDSGPETTSEQTDQLDKIVQCLTLDREDRYLSTKAPLDRFRQELLDLTTIPSTCLSEMPHNCRLARDYLDVNIMGLKVGRGGTTFSDMIRESQDGGRKLPRASDLNDTPTGFASRMNDTTMKSKMNRRMVSTFEGNAAMVPPEANLGDIICVLLGCSVPVILRKDDPEGTSYRFIGEAYLPGFMEGEILDEVLETGKKVVRFVLR